MKAYIKSELLITPVPRHTPAPWLCPKRTKIKLYQDLNITLVDSDGREYDVTVPKGYVSDWSSIPRPLWIVFPPNYSEARYAAVVHDFMYSHLHWYYTKAFADRAFIAIMEAEGASAFALRAFELAVKIGGKGGWVYRKNTCCHPHWRSKYEAVCPEETHTVSDSSIHKEKHLHAPDEPDSGSQ